MDEGKPNAPLWLKLIVAFHVLATLSWSMPRSAPAVVSKVVEPRGLEVVNAFNDNWIRVSPVQQYVLNLGFWQSWDMFAPNPSGMDVWCDALVEYKNGKTARFQYPRVYNENYFWKYVKERYRKYYERANLDKYAYLWEPFAKRISVLADTDPGNPPIRVTLYRHYRILPHTMSIGEYFSNFGDAIREKRVNVDVWFPPSAYSGEFTTSPYFTYEVPPR